MNFIRLLPKVLWRIIVWILPMNLLDGCLNRDPYLKIDHRFSISAICGSCPKHLINRDRTRKWDWNKPENNSFKTYEEFEATTNWTLEDITQFKLSEEVIIGRSPEGCFIADRRTGKLRLYQIQAGRDQVLRQEYGVDPERDVHPPSQWMWTRSRFLWPWFLSYYIGCLLWIVIQTIRSVRKDSQSQLQPHG